MRIEGTGEGGLSRFAGTTTIFAIFYNFLRIFIRRNVAPPHDIP